MPKLTSEQIMKALECCEKNKKDCTKCPQFAVCFKNDMYFLPEVLERFKNLKAENENLTRRRKPTEASGFKIENGKVVFFVNILDDYRHEYENIEEVVEELNAMLKECYDKDEIASCLRSAREELNTAKTEAYKEFAEGFISYIDVGHLRDALEICLSELNVKNMVENFLKEIEKRNGR